MSLTRKSLSGTLRRRNYPHRRFLDHAGQPYVVLDDSQSQYTAVRKPSLHLYCLGDLEPGPDVIGQELQCHFRG